ncbi:MAG: type VI secretion system lipoprotein TssJ, partial [Proteobacteria bacterium]|nr:type VI secretion system lipoprotein TssJ [Pseudomonadota bacterium]
KSENAFARASFRQLWKQDKATLGKSVIWRKEFIVTPHKPITLKLKNSKKAKYVAVVAIFRQPQGKTWRDISEINPGLFGFGKQITVRLYRNQVKIQ